MSSSELTEAGVLGLEDSLDSSAGSISEAKASEADTLASHSRPDLLTELKKIHVLDELIIEENLKIHELRSSQENPNDKLSGSKTLGTNELSNVSKERETFRLQIEKEKKEVEKLEKSLDKDGAKKTVKDKTTDVSKCSIMDKTRAENQEDQTLCDGLLSNSSDGEQRTCSASLHQNEEACNTENIQEEMGPDVKEATPHNDVPQCQDLTSSEGSLKSTMDLKEPSVDVGIETQELVTYGGNATKFKPEASLTPEMRPDDGAFDPGGQSILPLVAKPRRTSLSLNNLTEHETLDSTEQLDSGLSSDAQHLGFVQLELQDKGLDSVSPAESHTFVLNPNIKEHSNNNNNNHPETHGVSVNHLSEMSSKNKEDTSVAPACLPRTDLHPTTEIKKINLSYTDELPHHHSDPQLAPGGAMRVSGPGSPGLQAQLNGNMREVLYSKAIS